MREQELIARAAELAQHLDTIVTAYGRLGDLSMLPGSEGLRALGQAADQLGAALREHADSLDSLPALPAN